MVSRENTNEGKAQRHRMTNCGLKKEDTTDRDIRRKLSFGWRKITPSMKEWVKNSAFLVLSDAARAQTHTHIHEKCKRKKLRARGLPTSPTRCFDANFGMKETFPATCFLFQIVLWHFLQLFNVRENYSFTPCIKSPSSLSSRSRGYWTGDRIWLLSEPSSWRFILY
jgi:hypothetical protein